MVGKLGMRATISAESCHERPGGQSLSAGGLYGRRWVGIATGRTAGPPNAQQILSAGGLYSNGGSRRLGCWFVLEERQVVALGT